MDSSSRNTLSEGSYKKKWTGYHFSVVRNYVTKFEPNLKDLSDEDFFNQNLEKFFVVPKQFDHLEKNEKQFDHLEKNKIIAAFINFLLQLLFETNFLKNIHGELRFLLMVLGDVPSRYNDADQRNLFEKVEAIVNIAGSLVHSLILKRLRKPGKTDSEKSFLQIFKERMALLKDDILKLFDLLSVIINKSDNINTSKNNSSFYIVDSLICDLENLLNPDDRQIIGDVKIQIDVLYKELMPYRSLLKSSKMDSSEIQERVTGVIEVAYEVEYLINYLLAGDAPTWYFLKKIELITSGLQKIKNNYDIGPQNIAKNISTSQKLQSQSNNKNYEVDENIVVGFEERSRDYLDKLVGGGEKQLQIVFLFGMAGLGKTTFAKKLYNTPNVQQWFQIRLWCVVSKMYQKKSLLIDIIKSFDLNDKDTVMDMNEENLETKIYQSLIGRIYLIVIDDVWDVNAWYDLQRCFPNNSNGSRVLITSRNKDAAPPNSIKFALPYLSQEQCWELLEKKVFKGKSFPSNLIGVGNEITTKCHGLPLAVVVIAGILSTTDEEESAWKEVREKVLSCYSCDENNSMMQILELSYKYLPQNLKHCFLYFGVFPEDKEILTERLMRLWVAEGFIHKDKKSSESLAEEYLVELIDKSLVMVANRRSDGGVKACVIHDRLRDLCLKICEEENFLKWVGNNKYSIYEKSHRLVHQSVNTRLQSSFGPYVRSFHCHGSQDSSLFVANMKLVRVLDFKRFYYGNHLIGVDYLVNLRYLVIPGYRLSSIGRLVNLEYLCVVGGASVSFLILKMDKLRYLHFSTLASFDEDCNPSQTNNLQVLSGVRICNLNDEKTLKCSPHLRKLKCDCDLFDVEEKAGVEYRYLDLLLFTHLESLKLRSRFQADRQVVVEMINFPSSIKRLNLDGLHLPSENMSIIGKLPNLQVLKLQREVFVGETWDTGDGEFQKLTFLKFKNTNFKQWSCMTAFYKHFPVLQQLVLHDCRLVEFPREIGEIETLQLIKVSWCEKTLVKSVRNIEQDQRDYGNDELQIIIREIEDTYSSKDKEDNEEE